MLEDDEIDHEDLPPAAGHTALLIVDMINDMAFDEGDALLGEIDAIVDAVASLRAAAEAAAVPVIFVNDNFDQWHSDRQRIIDYVENTRGKSVLDRLRPHADDYFVVKPQVSGFYATNLPVLLPPTGREPPDPGRRGRRHLHSVHRRRCPYAGLWSAGAARYRRERKARASRLGAWDHAQEHGGGNPAHLGTRPASLARTTLRVGTRRRRT